jgi:Tol biopolymer transport system component/predicted Ser/Thr protein kinase
MSDYGLQRVEDLFHRAVELAPEARSAFLDEACGTDHEGRSLRQEIESLLAHDSENGSTFSGLAQDDAPQSIAHYRISGKLGQGGMGAVYRAIDTKLDREVAIKVLPRSFAEDADRVARFNHEAKVLASLNHANIAQIYGIEERALVMELVPGETLTRPVRMETALNYAKQIAEALEAAHERGIVHRDLKPANIVVTPEGVVKLLDFGLAAVASATDDPLTSPAITNQTARAGIIIGTAAYMSPEQAAGKPVDKRADVWSFGVVLWELLTGRRLFEGETISLTLASVLGGPIDFDKLPRATPLAIRGLLRRCLDRDMKNRLRDIREARIAIAAALANETPVNDTSDQGPRRLWLAWSVAATLAVGLAAVAFLYFHERPAPAASVRFQIPAPENVALEAVFSLSPDGRKLAFKAAGRLWVHSLESGESRDLTAAEGVPLWSPNGRFIAYPSQGKLMKIEAAGGPPQAVADLPSAWGGGAWNQDDAIVFGAGELYRVPASGGVPVALTALDPARKESMHFGPAFLPDGRHFVYVRRSSVGARSATYLGSVDSKPEQQSSTPLVTSDWQPAYASSNDPGVGYLLFVRGGALMAQPFDNRRMALRGQPSILAERVSDTSGSGIGITSIGLGGWAGFSTSANTSSNDVLVFQRAPTLDRQLTWYDRAGKVLGTLGEPAIYQSAALSPNGTRLAVSKTSGRGANIWLLDLSRGTTTRFTFSSATDTSPVWSRDGSRIIFSSSRNGPLDLYEKPADGGRDEELLLKSGEDKGATSWSPDGRFLLYIVNDPKTKRDVWVLPLEGDQKPVPFLNTEFQERNPHFSPDGRWVAYNSDESGHMEVYVRPFSMNSDGTVAKGAKWQISNGIGMDPSWRGDGRELYYWTDRGAGMAVDIATTPEFKPGKPHPLGMPPLLPPRNATADGQRFLMPVPKSSQPEPYTVVMNWQAGLKK